MENIVFTPNEIKAMKDMLTTFAQMQDERQIEPGAFNTPLEARFNNAMCALIDLMYLTEETTQIVSECGY